MTEKFRDGVKTLFAMIAGLWGVPVVLYGIIWAIFNGGFSGYEITRDFNLFSWTFLNGAGLWFVVGLWLIFTAVVVAFWCEEFRLPVRLAAIPLVVAIVTLAWPWWTTVWDNDKDLGRYYANSTVFYVNDPAASIPDSLKNLVDGASKDAEGCELLGKHDVRGCVRKGSLNTEGWDARVSSAEGAKNAIRRKTDGVQRVSLRDETVTYLNAKGNSPAVWSGVLDGSAKEQELYGVAEWPGTGDPTVCRFEGKYGITRAFGGERGNSLPNMLADRFPTMRWDIGDVWGYCDGDQPIVVVPMTKPVKWMDRTVDTAAGIVLVQGENGNLKLTHVTEVKAGEYRGPVYPGSLIAKQRHETQWTAGRKNKDRFDFGYDPSNAEVQSGNNAEYLLRDVKTGRNVFVTPLTLRSSTSEVFVAYSVTYADEVRSGSLNELSIYVLDRDDDRLVNIDQLAAEANDWMSRNAGMFRANDGKLIEFTPINGDTWRVFGEMGGQVVYQLDISANSKITPKLVSVSSQGNTPPAQSDDAQPSESGDGASQCAPDLSKLDDAALASCLGSVTSEAQKRLNQK